MPLIFVTGISTAGKSSVASALVKRGLEAYDTDHDGISSWYDKETNERAAGLNEEPVRSKDWLDSHEWRVSIEWVKQIARRARAKPIFICGSSHNKLEVRRYCDKVIWLSIDEATIRDRLSRPRDHTYGSKEHELQDIIKWNKINEREFRAYGATIVDATQPLDKVIDEILALANDKQ